MCDPGQFTVTDGGATGISYTSVRIRGTVARGCGPPIKLVGVTYVQVLPSNPAEYPTVSKGTLVTAVYTEPFFAIDVTGLTSGLSAIYYRVFAADFVDNVQYSEGLGVGAPLSCFLPGTRITVLDNGVRGSKPVEELWYTDKVLAWDFARKCTVAVPPLWIMRGTPHAGVLVHTMVTDGGKALETVGAHRVCCAESSVFVPVPDLASRPAVSVVALSPDAQGIVTEEVQVFSCTYKPSTETTVVHNVLSADGYLNVFANGILTSCRFSNKSSGNLVTDVESDGDVGVDVGVDGDGDGTHAPWWRLWRGLACVAGQEGRRYAQRLLASQKRAVLFLDHQGVMRTQSTPYGELCPMDPEAVLLLNAFLETHMHAVDIVVSSDWRHWCSLETMQAYYHGQGITQVPMAYTPTLHMSLEDGGDLASLRAREILAFWQRQQRQPRTAWAYALAIDDLNIAGPLAASGAPVSAVVTDASKGLASVPEQVLTDALLRIKVE